jgi:hypothetical protein
MSILTGFLWPNLVMLLPHVQLRTRVFGTMQRLNKNIVFKIDIGGILGTLSS